jgi:flagellar biogenesis protein FliO
MNYNHTSSLNSWRLSILLGLGLCVLLFANAPRAFAIEPTSQLFQQNPVGVNTPQEKPGQPLALPDTGESSNPSVFVAFLGILLKLALVVGLIVATVWLLKMLWEKRGLTSVVDETKPIKLLTSTYLAPRKAIHLVEVGNRILVLGVGNDEITKLDVITDPAEMEMIRQSTQAGFPNILERLIHREVAEKSDEETEKMIAESNETVGGYVEKMKHASRKRKGENNQLDDRS